MQLVPEHLKTAPQVERVGVLRGLVHEDLAKLIERNGHDPEYSDRVADLLRTSHLNTLKREREWSTAGAEIAATEIHPSPVFVLGHWRSGTTFLQYLLCQDDGYGYVSRRHCFNPYSLAPVRKALRGGFHPRSVDNVLIGPMAPGEDEFAISSRSLCSPYIGFSFPKHAPDYDRFLCLSNVDVAELEKWKSALLWTLKKASCFCGGSPLILKSPPHTARIRLLLELFPKAKFVHLRRSPKEVVRSLWALNQSLSVRNHLERPSLDQTADSIIRRYNLMYEFYLRDRATIPAAALYEMDYAELVRNPLEQVHQLYEALNLPISFRFENRLRTYVSGLGPYERKSSPTDARKAHERILAGIANTAHRLGYSC